MRSGVVLAVHDGVSFLDEQLSTIEVQTRPADVFWLADDASTDGSLTVLRRWVEGRDTEAMWGAPSSVARGSAARFWEGLGAIDCDLIAFADQDDRWSPTKLERQCALLEADHGLAWCAHDAGLIDDRGMPLSGTLWDVHWPDRVRVAPSPPGVERLIRVNVISGFTLMVRKSAVMELVKAGLGAPPVGWHHDDWLLLALTLTGQRGVVIDELLADYRVHGRQQIGGRRRLRDRVEGFDGPGHVRRLDERLRGLEQLRGLSPLPRTLDERAVLDSAIEHLAARRSVLSRSRSSSFALLYRYVRGGDASPLGRRRYERFSPYRWTVLLDVAAMLLRPRRAHEVGS